MRHKEEKELSSSPSSNLNPSQIIPNSVLSPYENFLFALKASETKRQYPNRLDRFLIFLGLNGTIPEKCQQLYDQLKHDIPLLESHLIRFINAQKIRIQNREIGEGALHNYMKAVRLFCNMNDIMVNWKKISKGVPQERDSADDRIPIPEEIKKLLEHADRRVKVIALVMMSFAIRVGSWDYLKWKDIIPVEKNGDLVAAKIIAVNTKKNKHIYYSFITPEAYHAVKDWMEFRKLHGEEITGESWVMRDTWQKIDQNHGHRIGLAKYPKKLESSGIRKLMYNAWKVQGIRPPKLSDPYQKRHEFKNTHSFRKVFETICQTSGMNHNNIKLLMDHSLAESQNYHRPKESQVLQDYQHAIDLLTINEENRLRTENTILKEKQDKFESLDSRLQLLEELFEQKGPTENELRSIFHTAIKIQRPDQQQKFS